MIGTAACTAVVAGAATAVSGAVTSETLTQLKQLGELHQAGIPSDEEFAATKAKMLGL